MLLVKNVEVKYQDSILALRGISLRVPERGKVALLGANGAGKTTAIRALSGLLDYHNGKITEGTVEFLGKRIDGKAAAAIVGGGIAQVPEGRKVFAHLTVEENLKLGAATRRDVRNFRRDMDRVYDYFPALARRRLAEAGVLSGGEQQMLAIGRALMARPHLLLVDELSLGLAPLVVNELLQILDQINRDEGTAILLVEQNARAALGFADYGYVLETGKIVLDGSSDQLINNADVREFYLGMAEAARRSYAEVKHYRRRKRWLS